MGKTSHFQNHNAMVGSMRETMYDKRMQYISHDGMSEYIDKD